MKQVFDNAIAFDPRAVALVSIEKIETGEFNVHLVLANTGVPISVRKHSHAEAVAFANDVLNGQTSGANNFSVPADNSD